jgi:hypothetical protein
MMSEEQTMVDENANLVDDHEEASIGMTEIDNFDFGRAIMLMSVIEKCASVGVKATSISGIAQASLNEMNEEAKAVAKRRAEEFAKAEAAAAQRVAMQRREAEAKAKAQAEQEAEAANVKARAVPTESLHRTGAPAASRTATVADNNARRV